MVIKKYRVKHSIYVGAELRKRLDLTVLDIGFHTGQAITVSAFIRHLVEEFGDAASDKLKRIYGTKMD